MMISSGWAKGLSLKTPKGESTRPTSARVRGAILNMLMPWLSDALILDLFGGSGAIGIEAVSRGAQGAIFVEQDRGALTALRLNLDELARRARSQDIPLGPLETLAGDVGQLIQGDLLARWGTFDVIFIDPPYAAAAKWAAMLLTKLPSLVTDDGVLVFETAAGEGAQAVEGCAAGAGWDVLKQKAYGDTIVTILQKSAVKASEEGASQV